MVFILGNIHKVFGLRIRVALVVDFTMAGHYLCPMTDTTRQSFMLKN